MNNIWAAIGISGLVSLALRVSPVAVYKIIRKRNYIDLRFLDITMSAIVGGLLSNQVFSGLFKSNLTKQSALDSCQNVIAVLVTGYISNRFGAITGFICGFLFLGLTMFLVGYVH